MGMFFSPLQIGILFSVVFGCVALQLASGYVPCFDFLQFSVNNAEYRAYCALRDSDREGAIILLKSIDITKNGAKRDRVIYNLGLLSDEPSRLSSSGASDTPLMTSGGNADKISGSQAGITPNTISLTPRLQDTMVNNAWIEEQKRRLLQQQLNRDEFVRREILAK